MSHGRSARIVSATEGEWLSWLGQPIRYVASGAETSETYALSWAGVPPGSGNPPHRHSFDEGFYVLSGRLAFTAGNRKIELPAGGFIQIRAGTAHMLKNESNETAAVLGLVAPAGLDRLQRELGRAVDGPDGPHEPPTEGLLERLRAAAPRFGIDLDPPAEAFQVEPEITVRQPGEGPTFAVVGDLYTFLATSEATGGRYAIWHASVPPGGGPPPHVHSLEEEGFYVLEGEITFRAEGREVMAGPGSYAGMPPGVPHSFRNESTKPARALIFVAPGGLERMFTETGQPWPEGSGPPPAPTKQEIGRLLAVAPRYGVTIMPPPEGHH